jgi:hypothetical protein
VGPVSANTSVRSQTQASPPSYEEPAKRRPGYANFAENDTTCCYALQDKVWVHGPGDEQWEVYTVKADAPAATSVRPDGGSGPCECGTA